MPSPTKIRKAMEAKLDQHQQEEVAAYMRVNGDEEFTDIAERFTQRFEKPVSRNDVISIFHKFLVDARRKNPHAN